jgi:hypothetical protein
LQFVASAGGARLTSNEHALRCRHIAALTWELPDVEYDRRRRAGVSIAISSLGQGTERRV